MNKSAIDIDLAPVLHRRLTVLGSTGTIGVSTLDVVRFARQRYGADAFPLAALTAQSNVARLIEQAREFHPRTVVIGDASHGPALREALSAPWQEKQFSTRIGRMSLL